MRRFEGIQIMIDCDRFNVSKSYYYKAIDRIMKGWVEVMIYRREYDTIERVSSLSVILKLI